MVHTESEVDIVPDTDFDPLRPVEQQLWSGLAIEELVPAVPLEQVVEEVVDWMVQVCLRGLLDVLVAEEKTTGPSVPTAAGH